MYLSGISPPSLSDCSSAGEENSALPSPWDTTIGNDDPLMPSKKTEGSKSWIVTIEYLASNCSLVFTTNVGQCSAPGINSLSLVSIWHPLQTPKLKASGRLKKASKVFREASCIRMDFAHP